MNDQEFTNLVRQYSKLIFTVCQRFVKDYQEAENLTQDTFLTAYRAIDSFVGNNYKPWLVRIAANKCKDYLKSAYVRKVQLTREDEDVPESAPGSSLSPPLESSPEEQLMAADGLLLIAVNGPDGGDGLDGGVGLGGLAGGPHSGGPLDGLGLFRPLGLGGPVGVGRAVDAVSGPGAHAGNTVYHRITS